MSILVPLTLCTAALLGTPRTVAAPTTELSATVSLETVAALREEDDELARQRLSRMGSSLLPELMMALVEGLPEELSEEEAEADEGAERDLVELTSRQRSLVFEALTALPRVDITRFLSRLSEEAPRTEIRETGLEILGRVGMPEDLPLAMALSRPEPGASPRAARALRECTAGLLARPTSLRPVMDLVESESHPRLAAALLRGVASFATPERIQTFGQYLGRRQELDDLLIPAIGEMALRVLQPVEEDTRWRLRSALMSPVPERVAAASIALGRIEDVASVPQLIQILELDDERTRPSAARALARIWRSDRERSPSEWRALLQEADSEHDALVAELQGLGSRADPANVIQTLAKVSTVHLYREDLTEHLAPLLTHRKSQVRALVCRTLERLETPAAIPLLIDTLEFDGDEEVRTVAWQALRAATGLELPHEAEAWRKAPSRDAVR